MCIDLFFSENLLVRGVQLNKQDEKGKTALMASLKEASMINLLLSYGANPCLQESVSYLRTFRKISELRMCTCKYMHPIYSSSGLLKCITTYVALIRYYVY